jgi:hypothetical protein
MAARAGRVAVPAPPAPVAGRKRKLARGGAPARDADADAEVEVQAPADAEAEAPAEAAPPAAKKAKQQQPAAGAVGDASAGPGRFGGLEVDENGARPPRAAFVVPVGTDAALSVSLVVGGEDDGAFDSLEVSEATRNAMRELSFTHMTEIQRCACPGPAHAPHTP